MMAVVSSDTFNYKANMSSKEKQQLNTPIKEEDDQACLYATLLSSFQLVPAILIAAIELNLFDIMSQSAPPGAFMSASEIASHLPTQHPELSDRLDRMLLVLACFSVVNCCDRTNEDGRIERLYRLSLVGKYFLQNEAENLAWFLKMRCHPAQVPVWLNIKDAILDDKVQLFNKVHGISIWEYMEKDPQLTQTFTKGIAGISAINMRKYLQVYKGFEGLSTLVDVGGGIGEILQMIFSKYPSIKGINFDLPQIIQHAKPYPGIEHLGGDMFESIPEGDAIMIKATCLNWSDEKCVAVLKNCYKALPQNGKVIILDMVMPEEPKPNDDSNFVTLADTVMFQTNGKERTEREFEKLCKESGFSRFCVVCRVLSVCGAIEFYK